MKRLNPKKVAIALAILGAAVTTGGCGSANSSGPGSSTGSTTGVSSGAAGCLPLTASIGGTVASGAYMDSINVDWGTQPMDNTTNFPGQTFGQVILTASSGTNAGPYMDTSSPDGTISLNFTPTTATTTSSYGAGYGQTGTLTFAATLSSAKQNLVLSELAATYPTLTTMSSVPGTLSVGTTGYSSIASQICIVSAAGNLSHNQYQLYGNGGSPNNPEPGTVEFYFYITSLMSMYPGISTTITPGSLTGTSLYSLNKIVMYF